MNLYQEIRTVLIANADIAAAIRVVTDKPDEDPRCWSEWPRTYNVPCVFIEADNEEEHNDLDGEVGLINASVTITCRAATADAAKALSALVRSVLTDYTGGVFDAYLDSTATASTPRADNSTEQWYDRVMSFTVIYTEAA